MAATAPTTSFFERYSTPVIVLSIITLCIAVYGQTYRFDFINIDDRQYIYENPVIASGLNSKSIWWAMTAVYSGNWHPVTWLTHLLDVSLYGMNAGGHHLTNVIIHTLGSVLAFFAFNRLTGAVWKSAMVATLFAVHPAHVESVAWIAERRDVLTGLFMMLTLLAYSRFVEAPDRSKWKWMAATFGSLALGLMSKGMLVTMPFVLLLCDYWPLNRLNTWSGLRKRVIEKLPLFILIAASAVITYYAQSTGGAVTDLATMTPGDRLGNVIFAYAGYLGMLFYPFDLGIFYPIDPDRPASIVVLSAGLVIAITALCIYFGQTRRYLFTGWFWFVGMMVPVAGFVQIGGQSMADRYTYVPYFGLFIILIWGGAAVFERFKIRQTAAVLICVLLIAGIGVRAFDQTLKWRNSETLYRHTLQFTDKNYPVLANLCLHYVKNADPQTAEKQCGPLLAQMPETADGYNILGTLAMQNGKNAEARAFLEKAAAIRPEWSIVHLNLAIATAKSGDPHGALTIIQKALASNDGSAPPQGLSRGYFVIAGEFERRGDRARALEHLSKAVELDPNFAEAARLLERMKAASK